jgi:hypothetical protein
VLDQACNVLLVVDDEHLRARGGANAVHALVAGTCRIRDVWHPYSVFMDVD